MCTVPQFEAVYYSHIKWEDTIDCCTIIQETVSLNNKTVSSTFPQK